MTIAMPLGVVAGLAVGIAADVGWGCGYLSTLVGIVVSGLVYRAAETSQRTWRVRCRECEWQAEVVCR